MMPSRLISPQQQAMLQMGSAQQQSSEDAASAQQQQQQKVQSLPPPTPSAVALLPAVPPQCGPPTVSLALLIDFAIHWNYRQFEILSELNNKKKETDRKISVVEFAHNTRLVFVRLLAIVRWLKNSRKFEPLSSIRYLLDEQAAKYVETADRLVEISRTELPNARLPCFQVAQAVDVLTLGTFPRLPQNIKDRFVSDSPLSNQEQRLTLRRLNHVIEFHLAQQACHISPRIEQIIVRNGMALLLVPDEFEISLTRIGDEPQTRWTLLNIRILVENAEVGQGRRLVHPLQVNCLHQMVQAKLDSSDKVAPLIGEVLFKKQALLDAFTVLHNFCRSLQLDVLYCQAVQISRMAPDYIRVEEYEPKNGGRLVISYWLRREKGADSAAASQYRLTLFGDKTNVHSGIRTRHHPSSSELPELDENLSLQRLLNETVLFRCRERLLAAKRLLEQVLAADSPPNPESSSASVLQSGYSLLSLSLPLIPSGECHFSEHLQLAVNTFSGALVVRVEVLGKRDDVRTLESQLNSPAPSVKAISGTLSQLRILVIIERLNRALVGLPVNAVSEAQALPLLPKLVTLPQFRRIFQFIRDDQFYLVISFVPNDQQMGVKIDFHLFSAVENRLSALDLDAEQVIRSAPLPNFGGTAANKRAWGDFCERNRKK